jgi:hypothetical protein
MHSFRVKLEAKAKLLSWPKTFVSVYLKKSIGPSYD